MGQSDREHSPAVAGAPNSSPERGGGPASKAVVGPHRPAALDRGGPSTVRFAAGSPPRSGEEYAGRKLGPSPSHRHR